jgi:hypothetical protein
MSDDATPPVRKLTLKAKEVTPTDTPVRAGDGTAISVRLIHRVNVLAKERGATLGAAHPIADQAPDSGSAGEPSPFAPKDFERTNAPAAAGDGTEISTHQILKDNRTAAEQHEPELVALPTRRSKRMRDFIMLEAIAVGFMGCVLLALPKSEAVLLLFLSLLGIFTGVLAWIIFGVMDDY